MPSSSSALTTCAGLNCGEPDFAVFLRRVWALGRRAAGFDLLRVAGFDLGLRCATSLGLVTARSNSPPTLTVAFDATARRRLLALRRLARLSSAASTARNTGKIFARADLRLDESLMACR